MTLCPAKQTLGQIAADGANGAERAKLYKAAGDRLAGHLCGASELVFPA
ncbi:MAG: hypothetical protein ABJH45_12700 [Paracoccaceae bacterium]